MGKEIQGLLSILCQQKLGSVPDRSGIYEAGICKLPDDLLQGKKVGIFPCQDKIADLGSSQREADPVQHIKYDQFI